MSKPTTKKLADFDADTVGEGTVIWLKGTPTEVLSAFLDKLTARGLDMTYAGPGDRYQVIKVVK